ncbi:hypothetical protein [Nonomuraea sp. NPDC049480]|uniref:hypothetical protein n=1 Tax=Nonomuraea sp. NPDC049480 TaxID=3364353 RepID=UPI0037B202E3
MADVFETAIEELAGEANQQVDWATAAVTEQGGRLLTPLIPDGVPFEAVFGERATLDAFLPGPVEPARDYERAELSPAGDT